MKITIEGRQGEGRSLLARVVAGILQMRGETTQIIDGGIEGPKRANHRIIVRQGEK